MTLKVVKTIQYAAVSLGLMLSLIRLFNFPLDCRPALAEQIMRLGKNALSLEAPCADRLLNRFLFNGNRYRDFISDMKTRSKGIGIKDFYIDGSLAWGEVLLVMNDGSGHKLCTFAELKLWSAENRKADWVSFALILSGTLAGLVFDLLSTQRKRAAETSSAHFFS